MELVKLSEALSSVGCQIMKYDNQYEDITKMFGNVKAFICYFPDVEKHPISDVGNNLLKERMTKLIEDLYSAGYGIIKYERFYQRYSGEIELVLQTL